MKKLYYLLLLIATVSVAQQKTESKFTKTEVKVNELLPGNLYVPLGGSKTLVVLIAGSGPTNRDGNQIGLRNNSLRYLCEGLANNGVAAFSYDKRIIAQMIAGNMDEGKLSFDDLIADAKEVVNFFRKQNKFSKIIIAGHSEGSLIGMVAANGTADGFVSIAGAGQTIDNVITEQITRQMPGLKDEVDKDFALLKNGQTFELKNMALASIFRESVQPYIISWLKYDPAAEIKRLKIPVLIVNGTKDLQVGVSEAELLKKAKPDAQYAIIDNMNHILKTISGDDNENSESYNNPDLPVNPEIVGLISAFAKKI